MTLTEIRIEVREEEAEELVKALRVLLERAWPEAVVRVANAKGKYPRH